MAEDTDTATLVAPVADPRIDIVEIKWDDAQAGPTITVKGGAEGAVPVAPTVDSGYLKLAEIYHVVGETHIDDADGGDGYITDTRTYL